MCSNCSGDDLKPESFATFDLSSPARAHSFARAASKKRKRYRTSGDLTARIKAALIQTIMLMRQICRHAGIIGSADRGSFVNLNLSAFACENARKTTNEVHINDLLEIRVSADAIIEVYATADVALSLRDEYDRDEAANLSAWEESYVARSEVARTMERFRRARRVKYFLAYGAFVTVAVLAVWFAVG